MEYFYRYYPYLYAPLATDMRNLALQKIEFVQGTPFTPLLQLLSVLPPQSAGFVPKSYQNVMVDPFSIQKILKLMLMEKRIHGNVLFASLLLMRNYWLMKYVKLIIKKS